MPTSVERGKKEYVGGRRKCSFLTSLKNFWRSSPVESYGTPKKGDFPIIIVKGTFHSQHFLFLFINSLVLKAMPQTFKLDFTIILFCESNSDNLIQVTINKK